MYTFSVGFMSRGTNHCVLVWHAVDGTEGILQYGLAPAALISAFTFHLFLIAV